MKNKVLIGQKYGRLTIIQDLGVHSNHGYKRTKVRCICDCGSQYDGFLSHIKNGSVSSCGCLRSDMAKEWGKERLFKHGFSNHPLMRIWDAMIQRCHNPNNKSYFNYGGRGVVVCEEWRKNYYSFYNWAINNGWNEKLNLDKDIFGNGLLYSPDTCKFVTRKENNRKKINNIYIEYNGENLCLQDWALRSVVSPITFYFRIKRGWHIEKALFTPKITKYKDRVIKKIK